MTMTIDTSMFERLGIKLVYSADIITYAALSTKNTLDPESLHYGDGHINPFFGYAIDCMLFCTEYNAQVKDIPSNIIDMSDIPGATDAQKTKNLNSLREITQEALEQK